MTTAANVRFPAHVTRLGGAILPLLCLFPRTITVRLTSYRTTPYRQGGKILSMTIRQMWKTGDPSQSL